MIAVGFLQAYEKMMCVYVSMFMYESRTYQRERESLLSLSFVMHVIMHNTHEEDK